MDEVFLVDKPKGMTSFGVVARVRRVLSEREGKRVKVGHAGTLDPFATGLLIILAGKATKRSGEFLKLDKEYEAEIRLGEVSTTGDPEGEIRPYEEGENNRGDGENCRGFDTRCKKAGETPSREEVEEVVQSFLGESLQRVPAFSAVKIQGERAYKLARKGKEIEMPMRKIKVYEIEVLEYEYPKLSIRAKVSSGTYMRALGEDIGEKLGVGAYLTELRRTKIAEYDVKEALALEEFLKR